MTTTTTRRCHGLPAQPPPVETAHRSTGIDLPMRVCTLVVMLCGFAALHQAQLLSASAALLAGLGTVAATAAAARWPDRTGASVRRALSIALLLLAGLSSLVTAWSASLTELSGVLAVAVVEVAVAHALVQTSRRDLAVGAVVGTTMVVLAAGTAPGRAVAVPILLGSAALVVQLVVMRRNLDLDRAHVLARAHEPFGRSITLVASRTLLIATLVGVFALLLVPHPGGASLRSRLARGDDAVPTDTQPLTRAEQPGAGYVDLMARGPLSATPALEVPAGSPSLWRDSVLDTYAGNTWSASGDTAAAIGWLRPGEQIPPSANEGPVASRPVRTYQVRVLPGFSGAVAGPGRITSVSFDGRALLGAGQVSLNPTRTVGYTVSVVPETEIDVVARAKGSAAPTDPVWTDIPADVPQRVLDLGRSLAPTGTDPAQAVRTVEDFVRHRATYTLDSPVPAPGEDAVDDFLFNSRQGFCEHFASAEVVLLRAAGIPARLVTGYGGGTDNGDGTRTYVGTDAHAWVEAWVPGAGWVTSDPTAGAALAPEQHAWYAGLQERLDQLTRSAAGRAMLAVALAAVLVLTWCVLVLARRTWRTRRSSRRPTAATSPKAEPDPLPAFRRLEAALVTAGTARSPAESLGELSRRLPTGAADAAALATVGSTCYAAEPPDSITRHAASARLDDFTATLIDQPPPPHT